MKRPFLIFISIIAFLITGTLWFIQSAQFARIFKGAVAKYLPGDLGIDSDFSEFAIKMFPPGISLKNPEIVLRKHNIVRMPPGSVIRAERVDFTFQLFQMFSGTIRVHEVAIVNGDIRLILDRFDQPKQKKARKLGPDFHWDELLQVRAEAVELRNTKVHLEVSETEHSADFIANTLRSAQWSGKGGLGYEMTVDLTGLDSDYLRKSPLSGPLEKIKAEFTVNALGFGIRAVEIATQGIQVKASGTVKGDILNPKGLSLDAVATVEGEISQFAHLLGKAKKGERPELEGAVFFSGKVAGDLEKPMDTLRAEGTLDGKKIRFRQWSAEQVQAVGTWVAAPSGGQVKLTKATLSSPERPRSLTPTQPADGGKIELGAFEYSFGESAPVSASLNFDRAHIHWLAAVALKDVFPLNFRVSGPLTATFVPPVGNQSWSLQTKSKLSIEDFQLDNQKLGMVKPLKRVLKISKIGLEGAINVDSGALRPDNVTLSAGSSKFRVGGKIDFKTGYDLTASGPVKLADVGQIAETDIRGDGTLSAHVHGPTSNVFIDFDAELKDAYFLHLDLGDLKGRITWDDDPSHLLFRQVQLAKGRTNYIGNGKLDVGKADTVDLDFKITEGSVQDLISVFKEATAGLWWFPSTLVGEAAGDVRVSGGISMDKLKVTGSLHGNGWEYLGERVDDVTVEGGYDEGSYHITSFRGRKHAGKLLARISFDKDETFDWDVQTQQMNTSDFDLIAQLDVPIRGKLLVNSSGKGKAGAIRSHTRIALTDLAVRGVPMPASDFDMKSESGITDIKAIALGGQGTLEVSYDAKLGSSSFIRGEARHLDFSPVLLLFNPKSIPDPALAGYVSGALQLNFRSGQVDRANGNIQISEYVLAKTGAAFRLMQPLAFRVSDGSFDLREVRFFGNGREAAFTLRSREGAINGGLTGEIDMSIAEFLTSTIVKASGTAELDFILGGHIKDPTFVGRASFAGATLKVPAVESSFENISGAFQVRQNVIHAQNLQADLASGRVTAEGAITVFPDRYPALNLKGTIQNSRIKVYPFQFVKVRGGLTIKGDQVPYLIEGAMLIDSALSREKVLQPKQSQGLKAAQYAPPPRSRRLSDYPKFRLKIDAKADQGLLVQNELFELEAKANVTVVNTLEAPRIVGTAEVLQGKMLFKDRTFRITSAAAEFDSPTVINPRFSLTSNTEVGGVKVQMYASGRQDKFKVELSSTPIMTEPEIISLLTLGINPADSKRLSSSDRAVVDQGEAASLLLHSLDFNREVESKTGFQIQLDETVTNQTGTSVFKPQTASEASAAPKIVIRRRVLNRVDLSVGSTVGVGTGNQKEVNAEVNLIPGVSVIGSYQETGPEPNSARGGTTSYGMDVKVQKRFK